MDKEVYTRYGIVGLGMILYLFTIFKMVSLSPSSMACLNTKGFINGGMFFMSSITIVIFLGLYLTALNEDKSPTPLFITLLMCVISISLGVYYYFRCYRNNININNQLVDYGSIKALEQKYDDYTGGVLQVSKCMTYHTGDYYQNNDTDCRALEGCDLDSKVACDPKNGAKLVDFYVASSHQSCHVPNTSANYVSLEMLKLVLKSGARLVDFDIYDHIVDNDVIPVVRSTLRNKVSQNYIPMEDVWDTISTHAFVQNNSDPLLVHLNLRTNNIGALDKIAKSYVNAMNSENILEPKYSYTSKNTIATEAICSLFNKCIIVVTGECSHTLLDELVNLHTSHNARLLDAKTVKTPTEPQTFAYTNQTIFTIVKPNEWESNSNPESAWTHGVQSFMMNYWNFSKLMISHCEFFKRASFVMKNMSLQQNRLKPNVIENQPVFDAKITTN